MKEVLMPLPLRLINTLTEDETDMSFSEFCIVWSPQHAPKPSDSHYAFNFENSGWINNESKGCYEIWMKQRGMIDKRTWYFTSMETVYGAHNIQFCPTSFTIATQYKP